MDSNLQEQLNAHSKSGSKKKYFFLIIILILVSALLYFFLVIKKDSENEEVSYNMGKIKKGNLQVSVMATGNLEPTNSVDIGIEVSGTIKEIYVDLMILLK